MKRVLLFALVVVLTPPALADAPRRDHDITVDDYFSLATIAAVALAPDASHVAYAEGRWQASTDDRKTDLWVVSTKNGPPRRLTFDRANDRAPQWSADSKTIYFLGNRKREGEKRPPYDGTTQVWRVGVGGGDVTPVTRVDGGVTGYSLSGKSLWYAVDEDRVEGEWKALRERFKDLEYGHGTPKVSTVWRLDLDNWRSEKVIDAGRHVRELAASSDGRRLAMITAPDDRVITFEGRSTVDVWDAKTGKVTSVPDKVFRADAPSPYGWLEHLAWSDDGDNLAFNVVFDAYPAEIVLVCYESDGNVAVGRMPRPPGLSVKGYGSPLAYSGRRLAFLGEKKGRVSLCSAPLPAAEVTEILSGDLVLHALSAAKGGAWAFVKNTPDDFEDIWFLDGAGPPRRLTDANPQTKTWKLPKLSIVSWKGAKGDPVEGILELPPDAKPGERLPLVVCLHGGPTTADLFSLQYWIYGRTLFPAKGYAVLCPNYRGSTGYGDTFLTDLVGRENDWDVQDILKGVDALIAKGIADPERLGVSGWSNGGYLTNCVIAKDQRFKAASTGASILDTVMEWGANDEPAYATVFKKGFPWTVPENYRRTSPTYALDKVRTPTLIHVGGNDDRCPPGHSRMLYRALKEYLNVPAELVVYPNEGHGVMKMKNRRAKMEWDLAWFGRYLKAKAAP